MAKHPYTNRANRYAREIVSGKIDACLYVKQACQRHMDDLKSSKKAAFPYRFDLDAAEGVCIFASEMQHTKGKWSGGKILLEPWQCFFLAVPFGWVRKADKLRRFREIYVEIPRKNGKSVNGAIIGNYMLAADKEEGAEIYSGATTEKQAMEVFRPAWLMTQKNKEYSDYFGLQLSGTFKNPGAIYSLSTSSRFEPVVGNPGDGSSPHCAIIDEYHEHRTSALYDSMATGMGARQQPMQVVITTAGTNTASPCYEKRQQCINILAGKVKNDNIFTIIYTLDAEDDWSDFKNWKKANPNYGVSVFPDYLKKQHLDAMQSAAKQNIIKCKHLNQWCNAGVAFYNMVEWEKCSDLSVSDADFDGEECVIGVDLASKIDIAAKIKVFRRGDDYYIFPTFYVPAARLEGEEMAQYAGWEHDGYLTATPGSRIDFDTIEDDIEEDAKRFDVKNLCHDPWNAAQFITNMMKFFRDTDKTKPEDRTVIEIPQTVNYLSDPMKESEALIKSGKLHHDGNPVMTWMIGNVVARLDKKDNVFPYKEREQNKIDGPVAMIIALSVAMHVKQKRSIMMPVAV